MAFALPKVWAWDESFDVKNPVINEQHKKLFVLIGDVDAHRADGAKWKALLDYVVMHFDTEEKMFAKVQHACACRRRPRRAVACT
jgi:hemerythrin